MENIAVSTIVGAFILVLIVVSAATGFAVYISETQKNTVQMGTTMVEYGLEELVITPTYQSLTFNNTTYNGVGLLLTNPGIRDIKVFGMLIDGEYITKANVSNANILVINEQMVLYNYTYDADGGFSAIFQRNLSGNWTVSGKKGLILPRSSITRVLFNESFLENDFGIDTSLPTHTLEVISTRGRYFTTTFSYP
jgi:hypothetical protein